MFEQLRGLLSPHIMPNRDRLQTEQDNTGVRLTQLAQEHEQYSETA